MTTCSGCGANVDAVPLREPCPACGSKKREGRLGVPTFAAVATIGDIRIVVGKAIEELASLPDVERREVAAQLSQLAEHLAERMSFNEVVTDTAKVTDTAAATVATGLAFSAHSAYTPPSGVGQWIHDHPVLAALLGMVVEPYVQRVADEVLRQVVGLLAVGQLQLSPGTPPSGRIAPEAPKVPVAALHAADARPPPPPTANVCLPPDDATEE
jgi:hypothetical protein